MDPPARPGFSPEQIAALTAPLDRANVSYREQGRASVPYLRSWHVIAEANRIFGFDGWQRQTIQVSCVAQAERSIGRDQRPGWGVTYTALVRVTITAGELPSLVREGSGAGHGIDVDLGQAHESALKEAETDAMKRALMTFGNPFGLALYDKDQRHVEGDPAPSATGRPSTPSRTSPPASPRLQTQDEPAYRSGPPSSVLVGRAEDLAKKAGLTSDGIANLARNLASHFNLPKTEKLSELSTEALSNLLKVGINAERVAVYNGNDVNFLLLPQ